MSDSSLVRQAPRSAWKPGQSGNPAGRPKGVKGFAKQWRRDVDIEELKSILLDIARGFAIGPGDEAGMIKTSGGHTIFTGEFKPPTARDRIEAIKFLIERGYGKTPDAEVFADIDSEDIVPQSFDMSALDDADLDALERIQTKLQARRNVNDQ